MSNELDPLTRRLTLSQGNMVPSLADNPSCLPEVGVGSRLSGLDNQAKMSVSKPCGSSPNPAGSLVETGGGGMPDVIGKVPCLWAFAISFRSTRSRDSPGSVDQGAVQRLGHTHTCVGLLPEHQGLGQTARRLSLRASSQSSE
jgi:hypothetical protein